jgi:nitrogen fixation protein NifB
VVGIAGPGDPLANPEATFAAFQALSKKAPDLKLCISTNGLMLPRYVDELTKHNIAHVTITVNCVDPDIGVQIYPWISWNHRRIRGRQAAELLIEQQQKGLEMLIARDVLVKINSVMIPGINDQHIREVNRVVKQKGAFLHNIVPLIVGPEQGTHFSLIGQRGPTLAELGALRAACGGQMRLMRHCRQCRSDAVGMLSRDRRSEFTMDKIATMEKKRQHDSRPPQSMVCKKTSQVGAGRAVLMAVASSGSGLIDEHFGSASQFLIYEVSLRGVQLVDLRRVDQYCTGPANCGEAEASLRAAIRALQGCTILLCARIGYEPWRQLEDAGIQPNSEHALKPIEQAATAVFREMLAAGKAAEEPVSEQAKV